MLRTCTLLCGALLMTGLPVIQAQDPPPQQQSKPMSVTGTVKSFDPGKAIEVDAKGVPHSYDLTSTDTTVTVSPDVKVGSQVKVTERIDPGTGKKTVTIEPAGK